MFRRIADYWALLKSLQTGLLLFTGVAGYISARGPVAASAEFLGLVGSLALAISGSTVLNMVYDRDIDAVMSRTCFRPLPSGRVGWREAALFGLLLSVAGLAWAAALSPLYGAVVLVGLAADVGLYTVWLKRRTPWSILWGGIAGAAPVVAGRVLALGAVDSLGLMLGLAVMLWIPTHIMTVSLQYAGDYARAGVPVFPNRYGAAATQRLIILSTVLAAGVMVAIGSRLALPLGYLRAAAVSGLMLIGFALAGARRPTPQRQLWLFKLASLYMLGSMSLIAAGCQR